MIYAKIENGTLIEFREKYIKKDGKIITNPSNDILLEEGWKVLYKDEKLEPKDGYEVIEKIDEGYDKITINYSYKMIERSLDEILSD